MEWGRIFKTGAVAGAIYGAMNIIVVMLSFAFYRDDIKKLIESSIPSAYKSQIPMTMDQLVDISMYTSVPGSIVGGIIAGIIVCFIFALMYGELMGKDSKRKGLFLTILLTIAIVLGELAYPGILGGIFAVNTRFLMIAPISIALFIIFGYILGNFWERFGEKEMKVRK